jgi:hypothetical protein
MAIGDWVTLLGGSGAGSLVIFTALWLAGFIHTKAEIEDKDKQIAEYKQALALERTRSDTLVATGQIVREVMTGLREELKKE